MRVRRKMRVVGLAGGACPYQLPHRHRSRSPLLLLLLLLLAPVARANHESLAALYRQYYHSVTRCVHGQRTTTDGLLGVLILFASEASRMSALSNVTSILHHATDRIDMTFRAVPAMAASLSGQTISELLGEVSFDSLLNAGGFEADCIVVLDDPREKDPKSKLTLTLNASGGPTTAGTISTQSAQSNAPWGLDRIDARSGRDSTYTYGAATGADARIYILDTGVRASHTDFGGRAIAGYSSGCLSGSENTCASGDGASGYFRHGVIPASGTSCSGHGTHCASTAAGTTYGVAKEATIITVQVLSREGSGSLT